MTRIWVRRGMAVAVACLLLVTVGSRPGYPQPKELPKPTREPVLDVRPAPPNDRIPAPVAPQPPTVDQLIAVLEDLKRQREALDKREKAVAEQLKERLKEQQERLAKLGLNPVKPEKIEVPGLEFVPPPAVPVAPK
jgi:hypothetical protein